MLFFDFAKGDWFGSQVVVVLLKVFMLFLVQVVVLPTFGGALGYMEMLRERVFSAQTNHALVLGFPP